MVYSDSTGNTPGNGPLRANAGSALVPQDAANLPSTESKAVRAMMPAVTMVRDLYAGNARVRAAGTTYLPKAPGERADDYRTRLERGVFVNFYRRTVEGIAGFIFAEDIALGADVPPAIVAHTENIDNAGTHLDVFARDLLADALTAGHAGILVDYPNTGGAVLSIAGEREAGVRPYWVPIKKENILSWRTSFVAGIRRLDQLVFRECHAVPDGLFGETEGEQYRVFTRHDEPGGSAVTFELLEVTPDRRVLRVEGGTYPTQPAIPFVEVPTSGRRAYLESDPPLLDLAYLNVAHYQVLSDYLVSMHMTAVPIFFTAGVVMVDPNTGLEIEIGPHSGINSPDPAAKAAYVSHDGAALGAQRVALDDFRRDIGVLGLAMLAPRTGGVETPEAKRMDKAGSDSATAVTARGLQDAIEAALQLHANYLRLPSGGSVTLNRDYDNQPMDAATMTAYAVLAEKLGIPDETILLMLQQGGRLPEDANIPMLALEMSGARMERADVAEMQAKATADALAARAVP